MLKSMRLQVHEGISSLLILLVVLLSASGEYQTYIFVYLAFVSYSGKFSKGLIFLYRPLGKFNFADLTNSV